MVSWSVTGIPPPDIGSTGVAFRSGFNLASKQIEAGTTLDLEAAHREFWKQAAWGLVFGLTWNLKR